ncbi:Rgg/GadR/MutR family transcriptional regulator [Lactiplantibacillus plantarum]|uniref:helix-turn-helix domain-containing protein n=1 Tax=Lactiplantibacillus plantarum TaxID=1590 RepID=UPI003965AB0D
MTEIGEIYRDLRLGKHVTLKDASNGIVSLAFLSRFERGLYDISFNHLLELLDRINVQLSEFEYMYNQKNEMTTDLLPTFQRAFQSGDTITLKNHLLIWQRQSGDFAQLQVIQLKMMLTILGQPLVSKQEINTLEAHFNTITNWTFFELYLYGHSLQFFDKKMAVNLFKELFKKGIFYNNFRSDSFSMLFYIHNNLILYLIDQHDLANAHIILKSLTHYFQHNERDYYYTARLFNLQGLVTYLSGDHLVGLKLLRRANVITYLCNHQSGFIENEQRYLAQFLTTDELASIFDFSNLTIL